MLGAVLGIAAANHKEDAEESRISVPSTALRGGIHG